MRIYLFYILIGVSLISSCGCNRLSLKKDMIDLKSQQIKFPNEMLKYIPSKNCFEYESNMVLTQKMLSWVVYVDSSECSTCSYGLIYKWNHLLEKYKTEVNFNFIFVPRQSDKKLTLVSLKEVKSEHYLWIDGKGTFAKLNPHIPKNKALHTFLLDENNNVILVGNPAYSKKIEEMFYKIVEEKLNKSQE